MWMTDSWTDAHLTKDEKIVSDWKPSKRLTVQMTGQLLIV